MAELKIPMRTYRVGERVGGSVVCATRTVLESNDQIDMICGASNGTCQVRFVTTYGRLVRIADARGLLFCPGCTPKEVSAHELDGEGPNAFSKSSRALAYLKKGMTIREAACEAGITTQTAEMVRLRWIIEPECRRLAIENRRLQTENEQLRNGKA